MMALAVGLSIVATDLAVKHLLRRRLGSASVSLGILGCVKMVSAPLWLARADPRADVPRTWVLWALVAASLLVVGAWMPSSRLWVALLLAGSLSNLLERSVRGTVSDYVCLTWWPAFNLADLALTVGAVGLLGTAIVLASGGNW